MSERYRKIYALTPNLHFADSPIIIRAGAILSDTVKGNALLQLKLENMSNKPVVAVFVSVKCFDIAKKVIDGVEAFQYLDIDVTRNTSFGEKTPIKLPNTTTRSVSVSVDKVFFSDGGIWENSNHKLFCPLPELEEIKNLDSKLVEQFYREAEKKQIEIAVLKYLPYNTEWIWACVCGAFNWNTEVLCVKCQIEKEWSFLYTSESTLEPLLKDYEKEQAKLKADLEAQAKAQQIEMEAQRVKFAKKRRTIIAISSICALILATVVFINAVIVPLRHYNSGIMLFNDGKYYEALVRLQASEGWGNSGERIEEAERRIRLEEERVANELREIERNQAREAHYNNGILLLSQGEYREAISEFIASAGWLDADQRIVEAHYNNGILLLNQGEYREAISEFIASAGWLDADQRIVEAHYNIGILLQNQGEYREAISEFIASAGWLDSNEKIKESSYFLGKEYYEAGRFYFAARYFALAGDLGTARTHKIRSIIVLQPIVSAGGSHTVGVRRNGTVVAVGCNNLGQCNVNDWRNIIAVSAGEGHTVGLGSDGTVVAVGNNSSEQLDVADWTDIIAVSAGTSHTVGLRSDGTVVAVGSNVLGQVSVDGWADIIAISAGSFHTVGLRRDGTVVAVGHNNFGQLNVNDWADIIAVSAGGGHTVGLRSNGTVVAVGHNVSGYRNWTDIVAVSAGRTHTVGLRRDGTVVAVGNNAFGQSNVGDWADIIAISAGSTHTVGLRNNGTAVAVGRNNFRQINITAWESIGRII